MAGKYFLGIDQGTTGTAALLFDEKWNNISMGYEKVKQFYPRPGWVEHDGEQIYETVLISVGQALKNANVNAKDIKCIGIDNQGETVILWDKKTGKPIYPAIVWQDRRTAFECDKINEDNTDFFYLRTGLKLDAYFGATKISWVLKNVPRAIEMLRQNRLAAGSLDTWLIWKFR